MIRLTFLDDEYIDRPKMTEQKKPFESIVPSHHKWSRNKNALDKYKITAKKVFDASTLLLQRRLF